MTEKTEIMTGEKAMAGIWGQLPQQEKTGTTVPVKKNEDVADSELPVGSLQGSIEAVIHSNQALLLINGRQGRGKQMISSLYVFAKRIGAAYQMSAADDPFADFLLTQVESTDEEIRGKIREVAARHHRSLEAALANAVPGADGQVKQAYRLSETASAKPKKLSFRFGLHASRVLYTIRQFDELVLLIRTMIHRGVVDRVEGRKEIDEVWQRLRGMLDLGRKYAVTNCRRQDLRERNGTAVTAIGKLQEQSFVDMRMFGGPEELCNYFANYPRPRYAPALRTVSAE